MRESLLRNIQILAFFALSFDGMRWMCSWLGIPMKLKHVYNMKMKLDKYLIGFKTPSISMSFRSCVLRLTFFLLKKIRKSTVIHTVLRCVMDFVAECLIVCF